MANRCGRGSRGWRLAAELDELRRYAPTDPEIQAKERTLERVRWRLAAVAQRTATDSLGNAA
jgi:hypothetical protein